jgi:NAD(P)-dependent dehydrogenase (short-subunit alcohol dehydrogenase family)
MYWDLTARTVIVTGASSGIGAATARLLHQAGAYPVLAARRGNRLESLSKELDGGLAVPTDVTDRETIRRLIEATLDRYGRIDGLVNNAGVSLYGRLDELDLEEFTRRQHQLWHPANGAAWCWRVCRDEVRAQHAHVRVPQGTRGRCHRGVAGVAVDHGDRVRRRSLPAGSGGQAGDGRAQPRVRRTGDSACVVHGRRARPLVTQR